MSNLIFNVENKVQEANSAFYKVLEEWKSGKISDDDLREARLCAKVLVEKTQQFIQNVCKV